MDASAPVFLDGPFPSWPWLFGLFGSIQVVGLGLIGSILLLSLYNYFFHPLSHIKGPFWAAVSPFWIVGAISRKHYNNEIQALHRKYGPVVRIAPNEVSFATAEAFQKIHQEGLTTFTKKGCPEELIFMMIFSYTNLLTVKNPKEHKSIRRALLPAFTKKALLDQQHITQYHVDTMVDKLLEASKTPDQPFSLTYNLNQMIWSISGDLAFGEPPLMETMDQHEHMKDAHVKAAPVLEFLQYLTDLPILATLARTAVILVRKIGKPGNNTLTKDELRQKIARQSDRKDFLTAILGAKESAGLSAEEIHSNMKLLLMGGFDTSSLSASALFYHLLRNPQYYRALQADLRGAYSSSDNINCTDLVNRPLLNGIIYEALRLTPAINGHGSHRKATTNAVVEGVHIPKGTLVSADAYTIHRLPSYWAFPDEYRPERWIEGSNGPGTPFERDNRVAWRPFLSGPRVCIGREMALQTFRCMLAKIAYMFDLEEVDHDWNWERDAGSHFIWHDYDIRAKISRTQ